MADRQPAAASNDPSNAPPPSAGCSTVGGLLPAPSSDRILELAHRLLQQQHVSRAPKVARPRDRFGRQDTGPRRLQDCGRSPVSRRRPARRRLWMHPDLLSGSRATVSGWQR
jgi:hypothetical protein